MKSIFMTMLFSIVSILCVAQSQEHLSFKGVPIDGKLNDYVSKMKQKGFALVKTENGLAMLKGEFASYKNCIVGVNTLKGKDLVSKIIVIFPSQNSWASLSSNYFNIKDMLTEKYGQPTDNVEKFSTYEPEDDGSKMIQVNLDACKYYAIYETDKGIIELSIKGEISDAYVILSYFDKANGEVIKNKIKDDL